MPEIFPQLKRLLVADGVGENNDYDTLKEGLDKLKQEWYVTAAFVRDLSDI